MGLGVKKVLAVSEVRQEIEFDKLQRYLSFFDLTFEHAFFKMSILNSLESLLPCSYKQQNTCHFLVLLTMYLIGSFSNSSNRPIP